MNTETDNLDSEDLTMSETETETAAGSAAECGASATALGEEPKEAPRRQSLIEQLCIRPYGMPGTAVP